MEDRDLVRRKYNKTFHLPFSQTICSDDKIITDFSLIQDEEIIVLEKMDGECTTIYKDYYHARSIDSKEAEWRSHIAVIQNLISPMLGDSILNGENMYAKHSIHYTNLESYFYAFSLWDLDTRWPWDDFVNFVDQYNSGTYEDYNIKIPTILYRGKFDLKVLEKLAQQIDPETQEGFVLQPTASFNRSNFSKLVMKYVRKDHIQTDEHWMSTKIVKNLRNK